MISKLISLEFAENILEVGGKAINLRYLIKSGFPVPAGFVLSAGDSINSSMSSELNNVFPKLNPPLIVRSSATIEDAIVTSFAGQFESFYPISSHQELLDAIHKVQASRKTEKIINYLNHYNISPDEFKIAAIIQEYKVPVWSGVIFIDEVAGVKRLIIEMSPKAEGVVSGKASPLRFVIDYSTKQVIEKTNKADNLEKLLNELIELSIAIEIKFKQSQDIEWVYDGKQVWIVQSRPITAHITQSTSIIEEELTRLENLLGPKPPHLVAHQFAEGLEHATPITTSLFQKFFSADGSLGQVMKSYFVPFQNFESKQYVVNILGRLFLNKDYEKDFLFSRIPRKPLHESGSSLAMPLYRTSWYYPGFLDLLKMFPSLILLYVGDAKFQISAYRNFKKLKKVLKKKQIDKNIDLPLSINSVRLIVDRLVNKTTPLLFKIALFQQFALSYLEKKIKPHVNNDEWQNLIKTGIVDKMASIARNKTSDRTSILKEVAHRGFQELELSQPRWAEIPEKFFRIVDRLQKTEAKNESAQSISVKQSREIIIEKFPSIWDQQIISTFFVLYDKFSTYREEMHDLWVKEISSLRKVLLYLDREAKFYNSIWYVTLDEIFADYSKITAKQLIETRRKHEIMHKIPLHGDIQINTWAQIIESVKPTKQEKMYVGFGLTSGYAEGIIGTTEMLDNGEKVDILLLKNLDPAVTMYYESIKGVITEIGGQLAHAAIIAREYGLPIITLENATRVLDRDMVASINCLDGKVIIL